MKNYDASSIHMLLCLLLPIAIFNSRAFPGINFKMEQKNHAGVEIPTVFIPKSCTELEFSCDTHVSIILRDTRGTEIYDSRCKLNIVEFCKHQSTMKEAEDNLPNLTIDNDDLNCQLLPDTDLAIITYQDGAEQKKMPQENHEQNSSENPKAKNQDTSRPLQFTDMSNLEGKNDTVKELVSPNIPSTPSQGENSNTDQTIQNMQYPKVKCSAVGLDREILYEDPSTSTPQKKKYKCDECKGIFDQITDQICVCSQHMIKKYNYQLPKASYKRTANKNKDTEDSNSENDKMKVITKQKKRN